MLTSLATMLSMQQIASTCSCIVGRMRHFEEMLQVQCAQSARMLGEIQNACTCSCVCVRIVMKGKE